MTSNRRVVTGLGATTPGGTAPRRGKPFSPRSGARTMDFDWVAKYELPVTFAATIATKPEVLARSRPGASTPPASTPSSRPGKPGPTPANPRSSPSGSAP